ncbi:AEC family transporter [Mucisphaera calidilacus]|uniref:Membrane transport protein n=1 Tax=Mucisphaera calidilacus TaxID=2527982 RepID=A0A518BYF4_9BACT|nr:AEC family transporter [Mucisphaera calidilacus]QDU72005.1 Membrane transport protein [Mucisphaera calidilacus]
MVFLHIIETLLPIVLLVALGVMLFRSGFVRPEHRAILDKLVYWIFLPALLIIKIAEAGSLDSTVGWVVLAMTLLTLTTAGAGLLCWLIFSRERAAFGVVIQGAFRGNLAFVGLPVIELAGADDRTLAIAALTLAPIIAIYNLLAVPVLTLPNHTRDSDTHLSKTLMDTLHALVTNPFIIACVAGLLLGILGVDQIRPIAATLNLLGQPAAPLALISLGGALTIYQVHNHLGLAAITTTVKLGLGPALAVLLAWALQLDQQQAFAFLILASTPTAVASYVLVTQLRGDEGLAASIIATTTLACPFSLAASLAVIHAWPA